MGSTAARIAKGKPSKSGRSAAAKADKSAFFSKNEAQGSFFPNVQTKLNIGQPGDRYEVEADAMADRVVQRLQGSDTDHTPFFQSYNANAALQAKRDPCEEEVQTKELESIDNTPESLRTKSSADDYQSPPNGKGTSSPDVIQMQPAHLPPVIKKTPIDQEELQTKKEDGSEEETVQLKCAICEGEEVQAQLEEPMVQTIQAKCADCEEEAQTKPLPGIQAKEGTISGATALSSQLNSSKGSGSLMPESTKDSMESSFGADFSGIRIHTDGKAVQMNQTLNAQAFTHGNDIYFNQGKYDKNSNDGKHLLAHELTHTLQQRGDLQRKLNGTKQNVVGSTLGIDIPENKGVENRMDGENNTAEVSTAFEEKIQKELGIDSEKLNAPVETNAAAKGEREKIKGAELSGVNSGVDKMIAEKEALFSKNKEAHGENTEKANAPQTQEELKAEERPGKIQEEIQKSKVDISAIALPVEEVASPGQKSSASFSALRGKTQDAGILALGETIKQKTDGLRQVAAGKAVTASQTLKATGAAKRRMVGTTISTCQQQIQGIMSSTTQRVTESHVAVSGEIQTAGETAKATNTENKEAEVSRLHETITTKKQEAEDVFIQADADIIQAGADEGNRGQLYANDLATRAVEMGRSDAAYYRGTEEDHDMGEDKADAVMQVANRYARELRNHGNELKSNVTSQAAEATEQVSAEKEPVISGFNDIGPEAETGLRDYMDEVGGSLDQTVAQGIDQANQAKDGAQKELSKLNAASEGRGAALTAEGKAQIDVATTSSLMSTMNLAAQAGEIMDQTGEEALNQINNSLDSGTEYNATAVPDVQMQEAEGEDSPAITSSDINQVAGQLDQNSVLLGQAFQNQTNEHVNSLDQIAQGSQSAGAGWVTETQQNMGGFGDTVQQGMQELPPAMDTQLGQVVDAGQTQVSGQVTQMETDLSQNVSEIQGSVDSGVNEATGSLRDGVDEGNTHSDEVVEDLQSTMDSAAESQESWLGSVGNWFSEQLADTWEAIKGMADWGFILDLAIGLVVGIAVGLAVAALIAGTVLSGGLLAAVIIGAAAGAAGFAAATMSANVRHGDPLFQGVGHALVLGAFVGAGGAAASFFGLGLLAGAGVVALAAGAGTVAANIATGRKWDDHLLANMIIMGIFHVVLKPIVDRIPTRLPGRGRNGPPLTEEVPVQRPSRGGSEPTASEVAPADMSPNLRARWNNMTDLRARAQLEKMFEKMGRNSERLERALEGMERAAEKNGQTLEERLAETSPEKIPSGEALGDLPFIRGRLEALQRLVDQYIAEHPEVRGTGRMKAALKGEAKALERMETGEVEATPERANGIRGNLDGIEAELRTAGEAAGVEELGGKVEFEETVENTDGETTTRTGEVDVDVVADNGRTWIESKSVEPFGLESSTWAGLRIQISRLLEAARQNPVEGRPPRIVINFEKGVTPEVAAKIRGMGASVRGNVVRQPLPVITPNPQSGDN